MQNKSLRDLLLASDLTVMMEAHSGLSARIAEEQGFSALWASGLSISSALGLRDYNEISYTHLIQIVEQMASATSLPVLVDGDTGYGNANNFRLLVKGLERAGAAGVVVEDKVFPKVNSFINAPQNLCGMREMEEKIAAGLTARRDKDFVVIARTEALIAGKDVEEALERAHCYVDAGVDAIFVHSKRNSGDQIVDFLLKWDNRSPVVIAPTTYTSANPKELENLGVKIYICANHNLRASVSAMRTICQEIKQAGSLDGVGTWLTPLSDLFKLLHYDQEDELFVQTNADSQ